MSARRMIVVRPRQVVRLSARRAGSPAGCDDDASHGRDQRLQLAAIAQTRRCFFPVFTAAGCTSSSHNLTPTGVWGAAQFGAMHPERESATARWHRPAAAPSPAASPSLGECRQLGRQRTGSAAKIGRCRQPSDPSRGRGKRISLAALAGRRRTRTALLSGGKSWPTTAFPEEIF